MVALDRRKASVSERVPFETVTVGRGGTRDLCADLYRPPAPKGAGVLLIHGGGFAQGDRSQLRGYCIALGRSGYTCLACEYRLADEAKWPAQIDDVHTALGYLHDQAPAEIHIFDGPSHAFDLVPEYGRQCAGILTLFLDSHVADRQPPPVS